MKTTTTTGRVRCLSLWQPWATLVMTGAKAYETRGWPTDHRGPLLIHASKRWNRDLAVLCLKEPFRSALEAAGAEIPVPPGQSFLGRRVPAFLPLGAVLGSVNVVDCVDAFQRGPAVGETERAFGDFGPGRWAWLLADPTPEPEPVPLVGSQGLFWVRRAAGGVYERAGGRWME